MVPSASTVPSCRQVTLTPSSRTKVMSCSTTVMVLSRVISFRSSAVWWVSTSVMPATGSCTSHNFGCGNRSPPSARHCLWPSSRIVQANGCQDFFDPLGYHFGYPRDQRSIDATLATERQQQIVLDG